MWFVYMIECEGGSLYTGIAKDPQKRFVVHAAGRGARYTRVNRPLRIVYTEPCRDVSAALKRERVIKLLPRSRKLKLIGEKHIL